MVFNFAKWQRVLKVVRKVAVMVVAVCPKRVTLHAYGKVVYQWKKVAKMGMLLQNDTVQNTV